MTLESDEEIEFGDYRLLYVSHVVLNPSLQAVRAETMVDGLPRASSHDAEVFLPVADAIFADGFWNIGVSDGESDRNVLFDIGFVSEADPPP